MLYRKYRPKSFKEILGQEHVVQTLKGAIASNSVSHAYLFTGPRGTGKTTMARLLAKTLNCEKQKGEEPCNACSSCVAINQGSSLDLIEIDAASNRGIDEIRNIKDAARVAAMSSQYKIFIVDEAHMLTPPAFNALLKTLEEPPSHIIFILATTEPHKVLATILSRVQRFDFKKLDDERITTKLNAIAKSEKVTVDKASLTLVARYATGSLRDAESAFAKLIAHGGNRVTAQDTAKVLGIVPEETHATLLEAVTTNNATKAINVVADLYESGVHLDDFTAQFLRFVRNKMVDEIKQGGNPNITSLIRTANAFSVARRELKTSPVPTLPIELAIVELTKLHENASKNSL